MPPEAEAVSRFVEMRPDRRAIPSRWLYCGVALLVLFLALLAVSRGFGYGVPVPDRPLLSLTCLLIAAGAVYLIVAWSRNSLLETGNRLLWWILGVGLALRLAMFFSLPMMEDDFYRYLWDGAVTAAGLDPYERAPETVRLAGQPVTAEDSIYTALAESGSKVLSRINHPHLKTIYPPLAQLAFAAAYFISPWSLNAWRLIVLLVDLAALALLSRLLARLGLQSALLAVWWWNPLLVKEFYNSGHMDVLLVPLVLGALLAVSNRRPLAGALLLGLAAGAKFWPVVLFPLLVRARWTTWKKAAAATLVFAAVCLVLYLPLVGHLGSDSSGFAAYFSSWEMNDGLFMLPLWLLRGLSVGARWAQLAARAIVVLLLAGWVAWLCRRPWDNAGQLVRRALYVVAAMFMLSPTQFPWYFTWLLPLLAVVPLRGLLLLTALLPLYYLRFYCDVHGMVNLFDNGLVWLEYVPVLALLTYEWLGNAGSVRREKP